MLENERLEDQLLDGDTSPAERESLHAAAETDQRMRDRLVARQFVHGLLLSDASLNTAAGTASRELRLERAIAAIREDAGSQGGRVIQMPARRMSWRLIAASLALLVGFGVVAYSVTGPGREPSPAQPTSAQHQGVAPSPAAELKPGYTVVSGQPVHSARTGGGWNVTNSGNTNSAIRLPGGSVAILAASSEMTLDGECRTVGVEKGNVSLEGRSIGVRIGKRDTLLEGGPLVLSADGGVSFANLLGGSLKDESGALIAESGHRVEADKGGRNLLVSQVADPRLPAWAAEGRAEEFLAEVEKLLGPGVEIDRAEWLMVLTVVLAEPVGRDLMAELVKTVFNSDMSQEELRDVLVFSTRLSSYDPNGNNNLTDAERAQYEQRLRKNMTALSESWQKATPLQREIARKQVRAYVKRQREEQQKQQNKPDAGK